MSRVLTCLAAAALMTLPACSKSEPATPPADPKSADAKAPEASAGKGKVFKNPLVGRYTMELDPNEVLELRENGTANYSGDEMKWSVKGDQLQIGEDTVKFRMSGDRLLVAVSPGMEIAWRRSGGKGGKAAPQPAAAGAQVPAARPAAVQQPQMGGVDGQLRQLLLSSAWCSFKYNQITGATNTSRAVFYANGGLSLGTGAESYSSGAYGSVAGQSAGQSALQWKVQGGRLYVDSGEGMGFQDLGLQVKQNSNGSPILVADGKEYSSCR
jgi:hypothetical protein